MTKRRVIVVGGGPAGLMAAGEAAGGGAKVHLFEKMDRPALKLGITGKGRCNLTNMTPLPEFLEHFRPDGRVLRQAFARFFRSDLITFLNEQGVPTVRERGGRIFPASGQARDVVRALLHWVRAQGVAVHTLRPAKQLLIEGGRVAGLQVSRGRLSGEMSARTIASALESQHADAVIIATGGASYQATGSTGDGYRLAAHAGHTVVPVRPALISLVTAGDATSRCQGVALGNVRAKVLVDDHQTAAAFGEMLFTEYGLSGPIILSLSGSAVDALREGRRVSISIDLKPALDSSRLDARLLRDLDRHGSEPFWLLLRRLLPRRLIAPCIDLVGIPAGKPGHQISAPERRRLGIWLKDFRFNVIGHRPFDEAVITAGGVAMDEIDPRSMASRLLEGLYFAGEVLDIDADTGGYNLQAAFSTGWLAGRAAAQQTPYCQAFQ
jgi:predicted Rossmann fold flavoprotein